MNIWQKFFSKMSFLKNVLLLCSGVKVSDFYKDDGLTLQLTEILIC